jgi:hypothetical protein
MNPPASTFPAACRGVSERKGEGLFLLRIEDSPQLAAESFNWAFRGKDLFGLADAVNWAISQLPAPVIAVVTVTPGARETGK